MRYISEEFPTTSGYRWVQELRLLKRMSCTGCSQCGGFQDYMAEKQIQLAAELSHRDIARLTWKREGYGYGEDADVEWVVLAVKHKPHDSGEKHGTATA